MKFYKLDYSLHKIKINQRDQGRHCDHMIASLSSRLRIRPSVHVEKMAKRKPSQFKNLQKNH
jgi:hypothetical protein